MPHIQPNTDDANVVKQSAALQCDDGAGGDSRNYASGTTLARVGSPPCALLVGSGAGGDAPRNDTDDVPKMTVFRLRVVPEEHRETDGRKPPA